MSSSSARWGNDSLDGVQYVAAACRGLTIAYHRAMGLATNLPGRTKICANTPLAT
jgi:hypothetical protein